MARTDYYGIQTPVLQATSQAIRNVNGIVGTIAPEDYPDLISAMKSGTDYDNVMAQLVEETTTPAAIASFTDGANNLPVKELICTINPTETGTGTKSPSNPYVIGGHTGITVTNANKAIVSDICTIEPIQDGTGTPSPTNVRPIHAGLTITRDDESTLEVYGGTLDVVSGTLNINMLKISLGSLNWVYNSNAKLFSAQLKVPSKDIRLTNDSVPVCDIFKGIRLISEKTDGSIMNGFTDNYLFQLIIYTTSITSKEQLNEIIQGHEVVYTIRNANIITIQLSATELERARAALGITTYTEDFGQTVYGGELNATTGVLTITHNIVTYNGSEVWSYRTQSDSVYHSQTDMKRGSYQNGECDIFPIVNSFATFGCMLGAVNRAIYVNKVADLGLTTADEFKTWLTTHNMTVVYPLETPIVIQLDPIEVRTLLGANNLYHDCNGNIEVTYRANGALYVAQH